MTNLQKKNTYIVGCYWGSREETRQSCADRLSIFLCALAKHNALFSKWFKQGRSLKEASQVVLPNDPNGLLPLLKAHRRDIDNDVIFELGFNYSAWSGPDAALPATLMLTCGSYSRLIGNSLVIKVTPIQEPDIGLLEGILHAAVVAFDPEDGVVSMRSGVISASEMKPILEMPALFRYKKGVGFSSGLDTVS